MPSVLKFSLSQFNVAHHVGVASGIVISFGFNGVSAAETKEDGEYIKVDQEIVDKAEEVEDEVEQYIDINEEGFLQLDKVVKEKYGEELYTFFLYGVFMNNLRIADGELTATKLGLIGTPEKGEQLMSGGCSWSNFGKSVLGGAVSGSVAGSAIGGVGAAPGAGVTAIGGFAAGGVKHFTTCWW